VRDVFALAHTAATEILSAPSSVCPRCRTEPTRSPVRPLGDIHARTSPWAAPHSPPPLVSLLLVYSPLFMLHGDHVGFKSCRLGGVSRGAAMDSAAGAWRRRPSVRLRTRRRSCSHWFANSQIRCEGIASRAESDLLDRDRMASDGSRLCKICVVDLRSMG
jgi:hypothetical protein